MFRTAVTLLAVGFAVAPLAAQEPRVGVLTARLAVLVLHETRPVEGALVRTGGAGRRTGADGLAVLIVQPGPSLVTVSRIGFWPESVLVTVAAGRDTSISVELRAAAAELEGIVVTATRSERRIDDEPVRVEVLSGEEVEEKVMMTPGDITMMLNESSGLRVVVTSPSLGGANVRIQGMRGRYTQILSDGLPLYGGQTGGLGLLQIPPMDLGGVEIVKGVASSLYGGSAMAGVINLVSRRPGHEPVRELLANQTTRDGSDAVVYASGTGGSWGYSVLGGAHRQARGDVDRDGWTDIPAYRRGVLRPRLFWTGASGASVMVTAGTTLEEREGGTMPGRLAPDSAPYPEDLHTRRHDFGVVSRVPLGPVIAGVRGSAAFQSHRHTFGATRERDRHLTWFSEATLTRVGESASYVAGAALQQERYSSQDVAGVDYTFTTPGVFAQLTRTFGERTSATLSGRLDGHSEYGAQWTYRFSGLQRVGRGWSARLSAGTGYFAPTWFTEETEVVGLSRLLPSANLRAERAVNGTLDVMGTVAGVEVVGTVFGSSIDGRVVASRDASVPGGPDSTYVRLSNAAGALENRGLELLARVPVGGARATLSYTLVDSDEPLTPRHQAGLVVMWESEERGRIGFEAYYIGEQRLADNPYRTRSRPNVHVGAMIERRFGPLRVWLNGENLLGFRQTRYAPLVRPAPGLGGRWTTDVWGPLEGRTLNAGVRLSG